MKESRLTPFEKRNVRKEDILQGDIPNEVVNDLNYCLGALKIGRDVIGFHDAKSVSFLKNFATENLTASNVRILVLKFIADFIASPSFGHVIPQSQLYDFLTLATEGVREQRRLGTRDIVFRIYRDIMENYQNSDNILRNNYPTIIVDVVSALDTGLDTNGKRVAVYGVYDYYLMRKSQTLGLLEPKHGGIDKMQPGVMEDYQLIQTLVQITGRRKEE